LIKRVFEGKGIPPEKLPEMASSGVPGVGIRGMQEKIHQLGGSFEISSDGNGNGTIVVVTLAVDERRQLDKLKVSRANRQAV
jgi:glucose-6-phosphate-specific signal transduction histidine kinase